MNFKRLVVLRILKLINLIIIPIPFIYVWYNYYEEYSNMSEVNNIGIVVAFIYYLVYYLYTRVYNAFLVSLSSRTEIIYSQLLSCLFSNGIIVLMLTITHFEIPRLWPIILAFLIQVLLSILWTVGANKFYFDFVEPAKCAVIYNKEDIIDNLINEYNLNQRFKIDRKITIENCLRNIEQLKAFKVVFLNGIHSHERNIILKYCVANDINIYLIPRLGDIIMSGAVPMHMLHLPFLRVGRYHPYPEYVLLKRIFDVISSVIVLIIASPIMLCVAFCIKLSDGGPILYKQKRLTKDGIIFDMLKFRSMCINAEKDGVARLSTGYNDARITPVGRIIRRYRIDELPQLFNILKGEMSVVGPRAERPEIAKQYEKEIPEFPLRLQTKAGLTGYAQVYGKYNTTPYNKLQMDLMYIAHASFLEDLRIIFATFKILFLPESTEGVAKDKFTAL